MKTPENFDVNLGTLDEFYESCVDETDFGHNGIWYEVAWGEEGGWDIYFMDKEFYINNRKWYETAKKEHFETLCDLAFNFKLKNDGRTIAQYICDYNKIPRYVVPVPAFSNDPERRNW